MENPSRYQEFVAKCQKEVEEDYTAYHDRMRDNGQHTGMKQVKSLIKFTNNVKPSMLIYLFGEDLGKHYCDKLFTLHKGNVLHWISYLDENARFYLIHEINNNPEIYYY